jgi:hypothetical protein
MRWSSSSLPTSAVLTILVADATSGGVGEQPVQGAPRSARNFPLRTPAIASFAGW